MSEQYFLLRDRADELRLLVRKCKAVALPIEAKRLAQKLRPGVKWRWAGCMYAGRSELMDIVNPVVEAPVEAPVEDETLEAKIFDPPKPKPQKKYTRRR